MPLFVLWLILELQRSSIGAEVGGDKGAVFVTDVIIVLGYRVTKAHPQTVSLSAGKVGVV